MDGHRLEAVGARPGLPEELRLIIAAGGEPDLLAQLARPAASEQLKRLGFAQAPMRTRLVSALFAWADADGRAQPANDSSPIPASEHETAPRRRGSSPMRSKSPPEVITSTITLKHKVQNGAREQCLATAAAASSDLDFARDGVAFVALPAELVPQLAVLQTLPHAEEQDVDFDAFVRARTALEAWLNAWLSRAAGGGEAAELRPRPRHHYLRHCIVRDTHAREGPLTRKTLPLQRPGRAFHIDSDHTDLVNIWMPLGDAPLSDHQLGFLRTADGQLLGTSGLKRLFATGNFSDFERSAAVVHKPGMRWGEAVVFRSGGRRAVVHGSFRFDGEKRRTGLPRRSVEFRCQPEDEGLGFRPVGGSSGDMGGGGV